MSVRSGRLEQARQASTRAAFVALAALVLALILMAGRSIDRAFDQWQLERTARSQIFDYAAVSFAGVDDDGGHLDMISTRLYRRDLDRIVWHDELRCGPGFGIFSTLVNSAAAVEASPLETVDWSYTAAFPTDGRPCYVHSTIAVEVDGVTFIQTIDSEEFTTIQEQKP